MYAVQTHVDSPKAYLTHVTVADLNRITPEWRALVARGHYAQPFFEPFWFSSFAQTLAGQSPLMLLTVYEQKRLVGVLPLMQRRRFFGNIPANTLSSLSGIHSCRFDFIIDPAHREEIAAAAWKKLREAKDWGVIEALNVPSGGAFEALSEAAIRDGFLVARWPTIQSPYLPLSPIGVDPFSQCPLHYKATRARLASYYRKLSQLGEPTFDTITEFNARWFHTFMRLEKSGWKGAHGGAIACNPNIEEFYRRSLSQAASLGQLRVYIMRIAHHVIAMEIGLVSPDGRYYAPKATYDELFSKYSPGHLLTRYIISDLSRSGFTQYDFLGPRARHKSIWAGEVRHHAHYFIFRPSLTGSLRHALMTRAAPRLKKLKYSLYGDPQSYSLR